MNFLAHLLLTPKDEALLLGNYLADFLKKRHLQQLPDQVIKGIKLHRKIDTFTDKHPLMLKGARRLYERHHKYAPVLMDVYCDYILAQNWDTYSDLSIIDFTQSVYQDLENQIAIIPPPFDKRTINMIQHDWLLSYTTLEGIADTFERMKRRVSKPEWLDTAVASLEQHYDDLNDEFNQFFPDIQTMVQQINIADL